METSLRLGENSFGVSSESLRIHAKQKLPVDSKIYMEVHGELDISQGTPNCLAVIVRRFYPEVFTSLGFGVNYDKNEKVSYSMRGKKAFPLSKNGLLTFNVKGRYDVDQELKEKKPKGAAEFSWSVLNFQRDQDVRIKVGYEVFNQVPYFQLRENNWTLNADIKGRWNFRYDL